MPEASERRTAREWPNDVACRLRRVGPIAKVARGKVTRFRHSDCMRTAGSIFRRSPRHRTEWRLYRTSGVGSPLRRRTLPWAAKAGAQSKPAFYPSCARSACLSSSNGRRDPSGYVANQAISETRGRRESASRPPPFPRRREPARDRCPYRGHHTICPKLHAKAVSGRFRGRAASLARWQQVCSARRLHPASGAKLGRNRSRSRLLRPLRPW